MAHYLVTGAAGFIGARTSEMLIGQGHTVVGIDVDLDREERLAHGVTPGIGLLVKRTVRLV